VASIVALRLGVGAHFLDEGVTKIESPRSFSAPFFGNATGPMAEAYKSVVWDPDGLSRLNYETTQNHWDRYRAQLIHHYGFDEKQVKDAERTQLTYEERLRYHLVDNAEAIDEYYNQLDRRHANAGEPSRKLASLQTHDAKIESEIRKLYGELIPPIDTLWSDLEDGLNKIASKEQWERHGRLAIGKPGRRLIDTETMDAVVPYFDLTIGVLLILGLFTRVAAIAGAAFLASVFFSQFPPAPGPGSTYYHLVEMLALLVLAGVGAGRFFGIDYLFGGLKAWCCPPKSAGEVAK
jgi:uncharacterized membrane protein YphA (DoxX/SURF4 family)